MKAKKFRGLIDGGFHGSEEFILTTGPKSWKYQNLLTRSEKTMKVEIIHCPT
ncbi:MAG TPA: hypothetical protein VFI75_03895 [Candidatus Acidoferrum sp.]|nr:hypothetical protein [Candidatus Acidoferrum sp.]